MKFFHFVAAFIVLTITFNTWDVCYKSCHRTVAVKSHCAHMMHQETATAKLQPKPCCEHQFIFNQELRNTIPSEIVKISVPEVASLPFVYPTLSGLQKSFCKEHPSYSTSFYHYNQHTVMRV